MKRTTLLTYIGIVGVILGFIFLVAMSGCTANKRAKSFGGTETVNLPKGQKLLMATWKDANLWYLTEPMDSVYVPQTKPFAEHSSMGILEGSIIFVESK